MQSILKEKSNIIENRNIIAKSYIYGTQIVTIELVLQLKVD